MLAILPAILNQVLPPATELLGAPKLILFDDPLAYPGFGLGENMIFPNYELRLFFPSRTQILKKTCLNQKQKILSRLKATKKYFYKC